MVVERPVGLGEAGSGLWDAVVSVFTFDDPRELLALKQACLLEDDLARLRGELADASLVVKGSTGQPVESPLLGAIRQAVALQSRLLATIAVDVSPASRSTAGRRLVAHRWAGHG